MFIQILCFFFLQMGLFAAEAIGQVNAIEGQVTARLQEVQRALSKGSNIFLKETIEVALDGRVQIRFSDGSLLNLIPGSVYKLNEYKFEKLFQKDRSSSELVRGGFRLLSGAIAKKDPSAYEIETPTATIGLRGTLINALLQGGELFVGVDQGGASIRNQSGTYLIGQNSGFSFIRVPGTNRTAELLNKRPEELSLTFFSAPPGGANLNTAKPTPFSPGKTTTPAKSATKTPSETSEPTGKPSGSQGGGGASIQSGC